jgi:D-alanyl-D-alanine carboxypeptidase
MSRSLLRWSIVILIMCLLSPVAIAGEEKRRPAARVTRKQPTSKQPTSKKPLASKRLVRIPGGRLLRNDAAAAFQRMHTEAREEGHWLWVISGHRTWAQQKYLYRLYRRGLGPRAARPGRSNHQRGTAVDVSVGDETTPVYGWLEANACRFGFKRTVSSEPWHWEYRPKATRTPEAGKDCQGRPLRPASPPGEVARPSPS